MACRSIFCLWRWGYLLGKQAIGRYGLPLYLLPLAVGLGCAYFLFAQSSLAWRNLVLTLGLLPMLLNLTWLMLQARVGENRSLLRMAAATTLGFGILMLGRAAALFAWDQEVDDLLRAAPPWQGGHYFALFFMEVFWNLVFVMINNQRLGNQLRETQDELARLASTDPLTGILNRRSLLLAGEREFLRASRYGRPLAVLAMDLDHFKQVNDRLGHAAGDRVLVALARVLQGQLRASDALGRVGGDEFIALLPETVLEGARRVAERLRQAADQELRQVLGGQDLALSLSVGISVSHPEDASLDELLERADLALYEAKQSGRNCQVGVERVQTAGADPSPDQAGAAPALA
ncbi:MAG: GGDEF domain-containing protein [Desulfarculus sp.]|nr:GGDEF domain-containing protein [Desulfarculus sp.]